MTIDEPERTYLATARVARLATADAAARPQVVPVCFALVDDRVATPIDEKPQAAAPGEMPRVEQVRENPRVALVADHYTEDWSRLGWVVVRGTARLSEPGDEGHGRAVAALQAKYEQYAGHDLEGRPAILLEPGSVASWGTLDR